MHCTHLFFLAALPTAIHAAAWDVNIGDGSLIFDPNNITAQTGDLINFHWLSAPHSIAQSSFDDPCVPLANGIWSGVSVASGPSVRVIQEDFRMGSVANQGLFHRHSFTSSTSLTRILYGCTVLLVCTVLLEWQWSSIRRESSETKNTTFVASSSPSRGS